MPDALSHPLPHAAPAVDWSKHHGPISLLRQPGSDAAHALTQTIADSIEPQLAQKRPLGMSGRVTHRQRVGTILAGLLKEGLRGGAVRAQRGHAGAQWNNAPFGQDAFWQKVDAMQRAGLVGIRVGVPFWQGGQITGKASAIWCEPSLLAHAAQFGLTSDRFAADWPLTVQAQRQRPTIAPEDLVTFYEVPLKSSEARKRCLWPADQAAAVADVQRHLERLNEHLASVPVEGCVPPVLRRQFFADVRLGGRFYAIGAETYQNMRVKDRHLLRLDGRRVVEVDLRASALSILLASNGRTIPADPYAVGPLAAFDRDAVKAWVVQSLNGPPAKRWSDRQPTAIRSVPIMGIHKAALEVYPEIDKASDALPPDLLHHVPFDCVRWAVGQWLSAVEAQVMQDALTRLMDAGLPALPIHDALLCREEDSQAAQRALLGAFEGHLGATPQVRTKGAVASP